MIEITVLGCYQSAFANNLLNLINFSCPDTTASKPLVRKMLPVEISHLLRELS